MSSNGALMQKSVYDTDNDGKVNSAAAADSVPWVGITGKPDIVQADWECDDSSSFAYIRNRPVIVTPVQADWDEDDSSALSFIRNKPEHFDQVQADWDESDSSVPAYINNKPVIPVVNNYTITITQGGVSKGSFTLNQGSNGTIPLDAGGGGGEVSPITAVEAETLSPGEQATATFAGGTLTLGIPAGSNGTDGSDGTDGTDGVTPVIQGGTATTVEYGSSPAVSVDSNGNTYTFNFSIPAGSPGTPGTPGANGVTPVMSMATATTLPAGSAATATMTSAGSVYTISLGIPRGSDGQGGTGTVTWGGIQGTLADQTDLASALNSKQDAITQATANTLDPSSAATVSIVGGVMTLGIPRGSNGQNGSTPILSMGNVATLDPGQAATATMTSSGGSYTISLGIPRGSDGQGGAAAGNAVLSAGLATLSSASSGMMLIYGDETSSGYIPGHIYKCSGSSSSVGSVTVVTENIDPTTDPAGTYEDTGAVRYGAPIYYCASSGYYLFLVHYMTSDDNTCWVFGKSQPAAKDNDETWDSFDVGTDMPSGPYEFFADCSSNPGSFSNLSWCDWDWSMPASITATASSGPALPTFVDITPAGTVTWGGIQGTLSSQTDLTSALGSKQNVIDNSHKLDYGLLSNTPTIPTVNNPAVVISYGGISAGSFTLNQSTATSISLGAVVNEYTHQSPKPLTHDIDLTAGLNPVAVSVSDNGTITLNSTEQSEGVGYRELVISAGTSSTVSAGTSCTLADEITAGAVNYCCVRFEDGAASVYVWKVVQQ